MLTANDLQKLGLRSEQTENTVLTVYLDVDQSQQANLNRGFERQLKDMLSSVRAAIGNDGEMKAFESASLRIEDFVERYQPSARGLAIVADASDGYFWNEETAFPISNQIRWGREAFVGPMVLALDEYERIGIVLLDRANSRLFTMLLGEVEEHIQEGFNHRKVRHIKTVGMDHLGSASRAQRKADEQVRLNLRHIAKDMDQMFEQQGVGRIILAGSPEITSALQAILPKRLESKVIGSMDLAMNATIDEVRRAAKPLAEKFERDAEEKLVNELITSAAKSTRVVTGLGRTLYALNQRRIWQLVYTDGFHTAGYECAACAALFSLETASCSFCGSAVTLIPDVVERAIDHAVRRGAKIEVIRGEEAESLLMNAGGIGAFLRTRKASVLVS
jgi:peptide subunit release factor 1 (eRF1)